jgi:excisionase family DNA binding protein
MDTPAARTWASIPQAARMLEVSPPVVRRLVARGVLPCRKLPGTHARIPVSALVELVEQHSRPGAIGPSLRTGKQIG